MKVLLAIDDDAARYSHIANLLLEHDVIVCCVQSPDAAEILLDSGKVFAVMLDHDMPVWNGQHYAQEVLGPRNVPVCVSSANHPAAKLVSQILAELAVPHTVISVTETAVEERWMGWLLNMLYKKQPDTLTERMYSALREIEKLASGYDGELTHFDLCKDPAIVISAVRSYIEKAKEDADDDSCALMMEHE